MLDPLTKAKSWLTIEEAAKVLGKHFGQEVSKEDIQTYADSGKLRLSIICEESLDVDIFQKTGETTEDYLKDISFYTYENKKKMPKYEPMTEEQIKEKSKNETEEEKEKRINKVKKDFENFICDYIKREIIISNQKCKAKGNGKTIAYKPYLISLSNLTKTKDSFSEYYYIEDEEYFYRLIGETENGAAYPIRSLKEIQGKVIKTVCTPTALEAFITSLLPPTETEKLKKSSSKTINTQNKVIAALVLYILKDNQDLCDNLIIGKDKHTAAKEIKELVENEIVKNGISSFISKKTLAEYISEGIDQLKP